MVQTFTYAASTASLDLSLNATDGTIERHVKLTWEEPENAKGYRVLRSTKSTGEDRQLIEDWMGINRFMDGEATPGVKYYYWVEVLFSSDKKVLSKPDKGHRLKLDFAIEEIISFSEIFAAPQKEIIYKDSVLMAMPQIDGRCKPGGTIQVSTAVYNAGPLIVEKATMRFYLSDDALWDETDTFINETTSFKLYGFAPPVRTKQQVQLPRMSVRNKYFIIVLTSGKTIKAVSSQKI